MKLTLFPHITGARLVIDKPDGKVSTMTIRNGKAPNGQPFGEFIRKAIAQAESSGIKVEANFDPTIVETLPGC